MVNCLLLVDFHYHGQTTQCASGKRRKLFLTLPTEQKWMLDFTRLALNFWIMLIRAHAKNMINIHI